VCCFKRKNNLNDIIIICFPFVKVALMLHATKIEKNLLFRKYVKLYENVMIVYKAAAKCNSNVFGFYE